MSQEAPESIHRYLEVADALFSDGKNDDGSVMLYQAVSSAMQMLAEVWGVPCEGEDDMHTLASQLDEKYGPQGWHFGALASACAFNDNAKYHYLDYDELLTSRPSVSQLVDRLTSYRDEFIAAS